jgi:EmrB/QacA subfamily drug resistance transporter
MDTGARRVVPGLMLVMLLGALDQTAMAPALPAVAASLGRFDLMPAVITAYLAAATVAMPLHGKLGDRFGRKPVLLVAIVVFMLGAVLCAAATTMPWLIAGRIVQGIGGGGLMIGAQAVLGEVVSPRERGRYLGLLGVVYVVAAVGGPLLGGLVVDHLTWRWIFALYPPLGLVALVVVARTLRLPRPAERRPFDVLGAFMLSLTVTGVILLSSGGFTRPAVVVAALITVLAAACWLVTARRAADPVLPLRLFRNRAVAIPMAVSLVIGFALFGTISYLPAFLQVARGASATQAGLVITALMAGVLITTTVSGRIITRTGRYKAFPVAGTALAALGLALLGAVGSATPLPLVFGALLLIGLGVGMVMQVMVLVAQNGAEHRDLGVATSAVTFLRQIGASTGVALIGTLITSRFAAALPPGTDPRTVTALDPDQLAHLPSAVRDAFGSAVPPVFGLVAPLLVLALVLAIALPAQPLRETAHVDTSSGRSDP